MERQPHDITFVYFGHTIRVAQEASDLLLLDFIEVMAGVTDTDDLACLLATRDFLKGTPGDPGDPGDPGEPGVREPREPRAPVPARVGLIDARDWELFWSTAKAKHCRWIDLLAVAKAIVAAVGSLPSGRSSDASTGRPITGTKSRDASSSTPDMAVAMKSLAGRGDLKMTLLNAEMARRAEAA